MVIGGIYIVGRSQAVQPVIAQGDINQDGRVDIFDLSTLLRSWGTTDAVVDIDHSGTVNIIDLSIMLSHWGVAPIATATPTPTPTPAGVSVKNYGAKGDGVTDDAPAIRAALAANDKIYIPAGTYILKTFMSPRQTLLNADFMFELRSNQTVTADPTARMKFADNVIVDSPAAWGGNLFIINGKSNVAITGGIWDFNGNNNSAKAGKTTTGYGVYTYGASHISVSNLTMRDTPGHNYIVMQNRGDDFKVTDSTFINGGTSLANNHLQTDFSAMYFTGSHAVVDRVHITHDQQPWFYSGGVELHGTFASVTNSVIEKSWPGVYIGPDVTSGLPVMQDTVITGNQFLASGRALVFNSQGTGAIDGVNFSNNLVRTVAFAPLGPARAVDQDKPSSNNWTYHHIITNLSLTANDFYDDDGKSDAVIRLSQIQSGTISGNHIHNAASAILSLGGSPWTTSNVTFANNDATWVGSGGAPAIVLSFTPYDGSNIKITANKITRTTPRAGCAVFLDGVNLTSIAVAGNTFTNIASTTCGPKAANITFSP